MLFTVADELRPVEELLRLTVADELRAEEDEPLLTVDSDLRPLAAAPRFIVEDELRAEEDPLRAAEAVALRAAEDDTAVERRPSILPVAVREVLDVAEASALPERRAAEEETMLLAVARRFTLLPIADA